MQDRRARHFCSRFCRRPTAVGTAGCRTRAHLGGTPEAWVRHQAWQPDISRATLANGALIGAFECEPLTGSHARGTVLPATLAVCERELGAPGGGRAYRAGFPASRDTARIC